jgi:hypothetical protein
VVDPVPPGGGLLNINREPGFDHRGRAVVTYSMKRRCGPFPG